MPAPLFFPCCLSILNKDQLQKDQVRNPIPLPQIPLDCYLSFLEHAFNPAKGRFKNFLRYDRRWNEPVGSEDSHGRALWGLGTVLGRSQDQGLRGAAGRLFEFSLPAVLEFSSPRAWAYTLLGIQEYLTFVSRRSRCAESAIRPQSATA